LRHYGHVEESMKAGLLAS